MSNFAAAPSTAMACHVFDKIGLSALFNYNLRFAHDDTRPGEFPPGLPSPFPQSYVPAGPPEKSASVTRRPGFREADFSDLKVRSVKPGRFRGAIRHCWGFHSRHTALNVQLFGSTQHCSEEGVRTNDAILLVDTPS
jgi:hypothetical protein